MTGDKIAQYKTIFEMNLRHRMENYPLECGLDVPKVSCRKIYDDGLNSAQRWRMRNPAYIKATNDEYRSIRVMCSCGYDVGKYQLKKHMKTQRHFKQLYSKVIEVFNNVSIP